MEPFVAGIPAFAGGTNPPSLLSALSAVLPASCWKTTTKAGQVIVRFQEG